MHGFKLEDEYEDNYPLVIGVLWSSLFRYYMFMTASTWGTWMQEIHLNEILKFPMPIPDKSNCQLVRNIVKKLSEKSQKIIFQAREINPMLDEKEILPLILNNKTIIDLQNELDELVFDFYQLTRFERNLIKDRCNYDIDYYYKGTKSLGNQPIRDKRFLDEYIQTFKNFWQRKLDENESLKHTIITSKDQSMICIAFQLVSDGAYPNNLNNEIDLGEFDKLLTKKVSRNVFAEGLLRRVSNDQITVIKRNRKSNWSKTEAKIDADASFLEVLKTPENT